jgi:hypothetical protein
MRFASFCYIGGAVLGQIVRHGCTAYSELGQYKESIYSESSTELRVK